MPASVTLIVIDFEFDFEFDIHYTSKWEVGFNLASKGLSIGTVLP
jgi:hypothetical protein